jgi:hypothetical protein
MRLAMSCSKLAMENSSHCLAKNLGAIAVGAGIAHQVEFDRWIEAIDRALSENTFFGSCNFVTYGIVKAS